MIGTLVPPAKHRKVDLARAKGSIGGLGTQPEQDSVPKGNVPYIGAPQVDSSSSWGDKRKESKPSGGQYASFLREHPGSKHDKDGPPDDEDAEEIRLEEKEPRPRRGHGFQYILPKKVKDKQQVDSDYHNNRKDSNRGEKNNGEERDGSEQCGDIEERDDNEERDGDEEFDDNNTKDNPPKGQGTGA